MLLYLVINQYLTLALIVCIDRDWTIGSLSSYIVQVQQKYISLIFPLISLVHEIFERAIACKNASENLDFAMQLVALLAF